MCVGQSKVTNAMNAEANATPIHEEELGRITQCAGPNSRGSFSAER
jgi:hypothetical protein